MDEPFSALDIQTRQLMENELLELWAANRKAVLFITHDLEEAIALSDRVVVLSAGPASRPIGEFAIDLPRPRDVAEIRLTPRFVELHTADLAGAEGRSAQGLCPKQKALIPRSRAAGLLLYHALLLAWRVRVLVPVTEPGLIAPFYFDDPTRAVLLRPAARGASGASGRGSSAASIYLHLGVTLLETVLAFAIGTRARPVLRPVARAGADRVDARRSLHQGDELDAARDPGADLRGLVRARHRDEGGARRHAGVLHRLLQRLPGREGSQPGGARQRAHARRIAAGSCCATSTCRARRAGCSPACTRRSAWPSSARWSASTSARRAASAT